MEVEAQKPFLKMKKHAAAGLMKTETLAMVVVFHCPSAGKPHQWTRSDLGKEQRQELRNISQALPSEVDWGCIRFLYKTTSIKQRATVGEHK